MMAAGAPILAQETPESRGSEQPRQLQGNTGAERKVETKAMAAAVTDSQRQEEEASEKTGAPRSDLNVDDAPAEPDQSEISSQSRAALATKLGKELAAAQVQLREHNARYDSLSKLSPNEIASMAPVLLPEASGLKELVNEREATAQQAARLERDLQAEHPDLQREHASLEQLDRQIERRTQHLLQALEIKSEILSRKIEGIRELIDKAAQEQVKQSEALNPYFNARREWETIREARDDLQHDLLQRQVAGRVGEGLND